jgi:hypothetical protein
LRKSDDELQQLVADDITANGTLDMPSYCRAANTSMVVDKPSCADAWRP